MGLIAVEETAAVLPTLMDTYQRRIDYLRISVTDRCNLRCVYCMPDTGQPCVNHEKVLTTSEIVRFVRIAARYGLRKVRITGGEPLVRKDILALVRALKQDVGIHDLSLTTNGLLLEGMADSLRQAGLDRVNVSLDTMDPKRYREITRGGDLLIRESLHAESPVAPGEVQSFPEHPGIVGLQLQEGPADLQILLFVTLQ